MKDEGVVELRPGVALPSGFEIVANESERKVFRLDGRLVSVAGADTETYGDVGGDLDVRMRVTLDPNSLTYEVESVQLDRRDGRPEISGSAVRALRFRELLVWGVSHGLVSGMSSPFVSNLAAGEMTLEQFETAIVIPKRDEVPRKELAAMVYVISRALGLAPLKRVAEVFGVSRSTAIRMMAQARTEGLLD